MTPHEARDALVKTIEDTAALIDAPGWSRTSAPEVESCALGGGEGVAYTYGYSSSPAPEAAHAADAKTASDYWAFLGMKVRSDDSGPVVFAEGGPVEALSFSTAPGNDFISGTSGCVAGNADDIIDQDYRNEDPAGAGRIVR